MLDVSNLSVAYGKHQALNSVSIQVEKDETVVILGSNGAGKTSLMKAIAGLVPSDPSSKIDFFGNSLKAIPNHKIVETGLALVPEGRGLFPQLSVLENLKLGANPKNSRGLEEEKLELVHELFPRVKERSRQLVGTMSGGEQQMVAIGRALMSNPKLLVLDEPSLGLAPIVVSELFEALERIKETGVSMLIVEQNVKISLKIADRGYLIDTGDIVGEGTAEELLNSSDVKTAFLGSSH
ncbi:ATP-binding cassette domain-containing protein [Sneathiella sp. P13V-1]|uniref:ABC transporter ATP-binding protein n=1 Tax=Sneathiella sp. P13V-1 TaxID=2697366 RepID=UPI00187BA609|nr:ABC transporter ATP-binding protein [Sneathiella sp. P13V-1]MBE7637476.1 ATP-binding cassette domain-containing protein [Sneathiella sp. P13V-1]